MKILLELVQPNNAVNNNFYIKCREVNKNFRKKSCLFFFWLRCMFYKVCAARHILKIQTRLRGYKTFFLLNSVEHEILNAHKYKDIKKFDFF